MNEELKKKMMMLADKHKSWDYGNHKDFIAGFTAAVEEMEKMNQELIEVLEKIANQDYRGPRPESATVAYMALKKYRGEK